jgi:hypothetical protein
MKQFHERRYRTQASVNLANAPYLKLRERVKNSRRYKIFESSRGVYQVEQPDSGRKHIVKLAERHYTCLAFQDY